MRILILDDDPIRHGAFAFRFANHECVHVKNYAECVDALQKGPRFDLACLDHDLGDFDTGPYGGREWTGEDVAAFIAGMSPGAQPEQVVIHSWNPDGAQRMGVRLRDAGVRVSKQPFRVTK